MYLLEITVKDTGSGGCSHPSTQAHTLWIPPPLAPGLLACPGFIAGVVHFRLTSGSQSLLLDSRQVGSPEPWSLSKVGFLRSLDVCAGEEIGMHWQELGIEARGRWQSRGCGLGCVSFCVIPQGSLELQNKSCLEARVSNLLCPL